MIKFEKTEVVGWEAAIRGMRNPKNSWEKGDSGYCRDFDCEFDGCPVWDQDEEMCLLPLDTDYIVGPNDHKLMMTLANGGPVHAKYRRMIVVYVDITAPLYWWKEFDTYKVGTVANSCSTMHKIAEKEFTLEDFSCEHLIGDSVYCYPLGGGWRGLSPIKTLKATIELLNNTRRLYLETKDKTYWWQTIQLLPSSYNQKRTVMLNYEVLAGIYPMRKNHKLDEWCLHETLDEDQNKTPNFASGKWGFCDWIESLPYSEIITCKADNVKDCAGKVGNVGD